MVCKASPDPAAPSVAGRQCCGPTSRSSGAAACGSFASAAAAALRAAVGKAAAPGGRRSGLGTCPFDRGEPAGSAVQARDRAQQAHCVRDAAACRTRPAPARCSTTRPAYITSTSSAPRATTPRSWVMRMIALPVSCCRLCISVQDLRLDRDVQRGGGLVGDQQARLTGQRHRDHRALAHAARKPVRIGARRAARARACAPCAASRARVLRFRRGSSGGGAARPRRSGRRS